MQTSFSAVSFSWLGIRLLHLWLRYQSLSILKFRTINIKRARILVKSHVRHNTVPGYVDCNKEEDILSWERFLKPQVTFGVSMEKMIGSEGSSRMVKALIKLYTKEKYTLFVNEHGSGALEFFVTFKVGATRLSVMKSLWQAYWLYEHQERRSGDLFSWIEESIQNLVSGFTDFLEKLDGAGWDSKQIVLKVPSDILFEEDDELDGITS